MKKRLMSMSVILAAVALVVVLLLTLLPGSVQPAVAGTLKSDKPRIASPDVGTADQALLVEGNTAFALALYQALRGEEGNPRDWIYCWYSRNGGTKGKKEWARNQRYKLYRTGEFYDISKDVLENEPLKHLSAEMQQVRIMLQHALDKYKDARPDHLAKKK